MASASAVSARRYAKVLRRLCREEFLDTTSGLAPATRLVTRYLDGRLLLTFFCLLRFLALADKGIEIGIGVVHVHAFGALQCVHNQVRHGRGRGLVDDFG